MPLMISRIGHSRGRPVAQGFGKCGAITRHSASVRSVWYRVTVRLCYCRALGVHMANPRLVRGFPWNHDVGLNLDIDSWLRSLGLGQYEAAFRDNAIDEK